MWSELYSWIGKHYPLGIFVICIIAITAYVVTHFLRWTHRVEKVEDECKKIEGHLKPQLVSINSSLTTLNGSFNSLIVYLKSKDGDMDTSLFKSKSPIQLTELGQRLLITIGVKGFIDDNIERLIKEMDLKGIKTALDSQTFAPIVISEASNWDSFNHIKDYTFKNPYYKEKNKNGQDIGVPLDLGTVTNVMGIYLRDKYLERNPHLNPEDIPSVIPAK